MKLRHLRNSVIVKSSLTFVQPSFEALVITLTCSEDGGFPQDPEPEAVCGGGHHPQLRDRAGRHQRAAHMGSLETRVDNTDIVACPATCLPREDVI